MSAAARWPCSGRPLPPPADAAAVLKSLEEAGRALKTMKAAFVETKVLVLLDEKQETRGTSPAGPGPAPLELRRRPSRA